MSCGKVCQTLWNNYLNKYGDFRERSRTIRNDQQCFMKFRLPRIKQQSSNSTSKSVFVGSNRKSPKKCDSLLPPDCCQSAIIKNDHSLLLNKSDREKLEKLIESENFPDNIFSSSTEFRPSIDNETELTSPINSIVSKSTGNYSITQPDQGSSVYQSTRKSELVASAHDPTASRATNPYGQLIERLRNAGKTKQENSDRKTIQKSFDSTIDANTHNRIQQFLSFLHSLDDTIDPSLNEHTLITLFSVDNHLSSSIFIPMNIQQLNVAPKSILHSLNNTPENEHILNQIQTEISRKHPRPLNIKQKQSDLNDDFQTSHFVDQDKELNSRLSNTYTIKAFKDYLIQHNKSARLPKLFHDLETDFPLFI